MAVKYVDNALGSNGNPGTIGSPYASIGYAITQVSGPGDTIIIRAGTGTYDESFTSFPSGTGNGTDWSGANPLTIESYFGEAVTIKPSSASPGHVFYFVESQQYIILSGLFLDSSNLAGGVLHTESHFSADRANFIRIENSVITGATTADEIAIGVFGGSLSTPGGCQFVNNIIHHYGAYAIYINSKNCLVEYNEMYDCGGQACQFSSVHVAVPNDCIFRNNYVHDIIRAAGGSITSAAWGTIASAGSNIKIYNSFFDNVNVPAHANGACIYLYNSDGTKVWNNTCINSFRGIVIDPLHTNAVIQNNICYNNSSGDYSNSGSGTTEDHNLFGTDPVFTGANTDEIQGTSPAINTGTTLADVTIDRIGLTRPQGSAYCKGSREFPSSASQNLDVAPATASWSIPSLTVTKGAVNLTLSPATDSWVVSVLDLNIDTVNLDVSPATSSWTVSALTIAPGSANLDVSPAVDTWVIPSFELDIVTVNLDVDSAISSWNIPSLSLTAGSANLDVSPSIAVWSIPALNLSIGSTSLVVAPATADWAVSALTLTLVDAGNRITQVPIESFIEFLVDSRITQIPVEPWHTGTEQSRVTQDVIEVFTCENLSPTCGGCVIDLPIIPSGNLVITLNSEGFS